MSFVTSVEPYYHHHHAKLRKVPVFGFRSFAHTSFRRATATGRRCGGADGRRTNSGRATTSGASNATDIGATKSGGGTATSNGGRASRGGRDTAGASTVAANASTRVEAVGKTATVGGSVPGVLFTAVDNNRQRPSAAIWGRRETGRRHRAARRRRQQRRASAVAAAIDNGRPSGHASMLCVGRYVPTPFAAVPSPLSLRCVNVCPFDSLHRPARAPMLQEHAAGVVSVIETVCTGVLVPLCVRAACRALPTSTRRGRTV